MYGARNVIKFWSAVKLVQSAVSTHSLSKVLFTKEVCAVGTKGVNSCCHHIVLCDHRHCSVCVFHWLLVFTLQ